MKIVSSYAVEIKNISKLFRQTIKIYKNAVSFCIDVFEKEWSTLEQLEVYNRERSQYADKLIHTTKSNVAKYSEFDNKFKKLPAYLRTAVIHAALGHLSSYHSNLKNCDSKNNAPSFQKHINKLPTFYRRGMYEENCDGDFVKLKLFVNNDWNWVKVKLKHTDLRYIEKHLSGAKMSAPTLEKKNKKYFLRFSFEEKAELNNTPLDERKILAVDLGINTDATCSVMRKDGTVLARKFIDFPSEKDRIYHALNKVKKVCQRYGSHNTTKLWRYIKFRNEELARKIAKSIVQYAVEQHCDVIVFEHLNTNGKKQGRKKQILSLWKKNSIQNKVELKAHKNGIRISRICAWGTSKLAFDGSGEVLRGKKANLNTYELCKFSNGKIYNCDLSASYNIGARYFIRDIQKSISVTKWSDVVAKVPECQKRTQCTYSTLLKINEVI